MMSLSDSSCPSGTIEKHYMQQLELKSVGTRLAFMQSRPAPLQTTVMSQQDRERILLSELLILLRWEKIIILLVIPTFRKYRTLCV